MTTQELEQSALEKYEDLLDTLLVIEAMRSNTKKGKKWSEMKASLMENV